MDALTRLRPRPRARRLPRDRRSRSRSSCCRRPRPIDDPALQRRVLARGLRPYNVLSVGALGVLIMTGASSLTDVEGDPRPGVRPAALAARRQAHPHLRPHDGRHVAVVRPRPSAGARRAGRPAGRARAASGHAAPSRPAAHGSAIALAVWTTLGRPRAWDGEQAACDRRPTPRRRSHGALHPRARSGSRSRAEKMKKVGLVDTPEPVLRRLLLRAGPGAGRHTGTPSATSSTTCCRARVASASAPRSATSAPATSPARRRARTTASATPGPGGWSCS